MPWTGRTFRSRHNHQLTGEQASRAAGIANAVLEKSGDEGRAIRVANAVVNRGRQHVRLGRGRGR